MPARASHGARAFSAKCPDPAGRRACRRPSGRAHRAQPGRAARARARARHRPRLRSRSPTRRTCAAPARRRSRGRARSRRAARDRAAAPPPRRHEAQAATAACRPVSGSAIASPQKSGVPSPAPVAAARPAAAAASSPNATQPASRLAAPVARDAHPAETGNGSDQRLGFESELRERARPGALDDEVRALDEARAAGGAPPRTRSRARRSACRRSADRRTPAGPGARRPGGRGSRPSPRARRPGPTSCVQSGPAHSDERSTTSGDVAGSAHRALAARGDAEPRRRRRVRVARLCHRKAEQTRALDQLRGRIASRRARRRMPTGRRRGRPRRTTRAAAPRRRVARG